jgi:hypothetical protein
MMPFTADCAAAFQRTYNISGGGAVFKDLAEATVDLDNACQVHNTKVRPRRGSAQMAACGKKEPCVPTAHVVTSA